MMEITFLGTGAAHPSPLRNASGTALRLGGQVWLFDCGEGTQTQLMKSSLKASQINKIFITHLHGDHLFGLPGLLCSMSMALGACSQHHVDIYGPVGLARYLSASLSLSQSFLIFSYQVHEMLPLPQQFPSDWESQPVSKEPVLQLTNEVAPLLIEADENCVWRLFEDKMMTICSSYQVHRIPSFGFVVREKSRRGKLNTVKLQSLGIKPGPLYARLKEGHSITSETGRTIFPEEVLGPDIPGRCVMIGGDSKDSMRLVELANDADVIVHEATLPDAMKEMAMEKGHSTPSMAADFARACCAKKLILTHFSQRFRPKVEAEDDDPIISMVKEAKRTFGSDSVLAARDLLTVDIPRRPST